MQKLKALAIDVKESVFEGNSDGTMYVVQDIYEVDTVYVFTMNTHSFAVFIRENNVDWDIEQSFKYETLFNGEVKERLINEIKRVIANWYEIF